MKLRPWLLPHIQVIAYVFLCLSYLRQWRLVRGNEPIQNLSSALAWRSHINLYNLQAQSQISAEQDYKAENNCHCQVDAPVIHRARGNEKQGGKCNTSWTDLNEVVYRFFLVIYKRSQASKSSPCQSGFLITRVKGRVEFWNTKMWLEQFPDLLSKIQFVFYHMPKLCLPWNFLFW